MYFGKGCIHETYIRTIRQYCWEPALILLHSKMKKNKFDLEYLHSLCYCHNNSVVAGLGGSHWTRLKRKTHSDEHCIYQTIVRENIKEQFRGENSPAYRIVLKRKIICPLIHCHPRTTLVRSASAVLYHQFLRQAVRWRQLFTPDQLAMFSACWSLPPALLTTGDSFRHIYLALLTLLSAY